MDEYLSRLSPQASPVPQRSGSPRNVIVYVSDAGFALPSIASAMAVRQRISIDLADIYIIMIDIADKAIDIASSILDQWGIKLLALSDRSYEHFDRSLFNKTHVPMSTLARFFIVDTLDKSYDKLLYLDGDVWPYSDITSIFDIVLTDGMIAAAEDISYFYQSDFGSTGKVVRRYFSGIGVDRSTGYFNAGVILSDTASWQDISREAFDFFIKNPQKCLYHDQSALNAVASHRRMRLPPIWNFVPAYEDWGISSVLTPKFMHFTGGFKPWFAPHPMFSELYDIYWNAFEIMEGAGLSARRFSKDEELLARRILRNQRTKLNTVFISRKISRRRAFYVLYKESNRKLKLADSHLV